jgi:CspA family cold shock protein
MPTGTIKKKVQEKGFGFISSEGSDDLFFHMSACNGQFDVLQVGATVSFDTEDSPKGKRAINVVAVASVA